MRWCHANEGELNGLKSNCLHGFSLGTLASSDNPKIYLYVCIPEENPIRSLRFWYRSHHESEASPYSSHFSCWWHQWFVAVAVLWVYANIWCSLLWLWLVAGFGALVSLGKWEAKWRAVTFSWSPCLCCCCYYLQEPQGAMMLSLLWDESEPTQGLNFPHPSPLASASVPFELNLHPVHPKCPSSPKKLLQSFEALRNTMFQQFQWSAFHTKWNNSEKKMLNLGSKDDKHLSLSLEKCILHTFSPMLYRPSWICGPIWLPFRPLKLTFLLCDSVYGFLPLDLKSHYSCGKKSALSLFFPSTHSLKWWSQFKYSDMVTC